MKRARPHVRFVLNVKWYIWRAGQKSVIQLRLIDIIPGNLLRPLKNKGNPGIRQKRNERDAKLQTASDRVYEWMIQNKLWLTLIIIPSHLSSIAKWMNPFYERWCFFILYFTHIFNIIYLIFVLIIRLHSDTVHTSCQYLLSKWNINHLLKIGIIIIII